MKPLRCHEDNLAKHGVTAAEVEGCLHSGRRKYLRKVGRNVYRVITQTASGRYLEIMYRELADMRFVFHAMDARPREVRLLKRRGKHR